MKTTLDTAEIQLFATIVSMLLELFKALRFKIIFKYNL